MTLLLTCCGVGIPLFAGFLTVRMGFRVLDEVKNLLA
jgi:hypothetical protein